MVHELTHALFGRAVGRGGGSWFQEGVAVYVEERWQKRSAATLFAPLLRGGTFVPLGEFLTIPVLIAQNDATGGAWTRDTLYAQAGAFFEFLLRGPYADRVRAALPELAALDGAAKDLPDRVAKALGASLAEIEKAWLAWGAHPPE